MSKPVRDLSGSELSNAREKVLEHKLLSQLAVLMLQRGMPLDILRSEFDAQGHDVVLEAGGMIRHVQLKASREGGKRSRVDINVRLRAKPSGCVVWMTYDPISLEITALRWLGEQPGVPLPDLGSQVTRHAKGDSSGKKSFRPSLRNVSAGKFERLSDLDELADRLFGRPASEATIAALIQLRNQFGQTWRNHLSSHLLCSGFDDAAELAHLIDGYAILEQLMEVDHQGWLDYQAEAGRQAHFETDAGLLWALLFLEHRRWRFALPHSPSKEEYRYLDDLAHLTTRAIKDQVLS